MKNISILGSTGSIGTQTLEVIREYPNEFKIVGLSTNNKIDLIKKQIKEFKPKAVAVMDEKKAAELLNFTSLPVYSGTEGLNKISSLEEADTVVNALVGSVGIIPTYTAIKSKKNIALANKESLVAAGSIIIGEVKKNNVNLMPIDSEHSALFQCLKGEEIINVNKIMITCSGGPFNHLSVEELENVTLQDALNHPTWKMGAKITVDSSTLMNKGFEVIEAHWLYGVDYNKIKVVIHPQSIIHSFVEFADNSLIAQLSFPDMKIPIQYALTYPKRFPLQKTISLSLNMEKIRKLEFEEPDFEKFPCLKYTFEAGKLGGTMPAVINAANEILVQSFLNNRIKYLDIPKFIRNVMDSHKIIKNPSLDEILEIDRCIKEKTIEIIKEKKRI